MSHRLGIGKGGKTAAGTRAAESRLERGWIDPRRSEGGRLPAVDDAVQARAEERGHSFANVDVHPDPRAEMRSFRDGNEIEPASGGWQPDVINRWDDDDMDWEPATEQRAQGLHGSIRLPGGVRRLRPLRARRQGLGSQDRQLASSLVAEAPRRGGESQAPGHALERRTKVGRRRRRVYLAPLRGLLGEHVHHAAGADEGAFFLGSSRCCGAIGYGRLQGCSGLTADSWHRSVEVGGWSVSSMW